MSGATFHVEQLDPGGHDFSVFDCGEPTYDEWLRVSAVQAISAGTCAVYALVRREPDAEARVVGYFAISPTQVVRDDLPGSLRRGAPRAVPAWLLAKLALDRELQGDPEGRWGSRLLVAALQMIVSVADAGGGKVIVVDADNEGLLDFYARHDFLPAGVGEHGEEGLRLFMKVSTARRALAPAG